MSNLVDELKKEHTIIVDALNQVKKLGFTSEEGQKTLFAAKNGLLAHLKKEDDQLYPVLHKAAENNDALQQTLNIFAKDMEGISKAALEFFDKYSTGGAGLEFAKDFGKLIAVLANRIGKEEQTLYKKFDAL